MDWTKTALGIVGILLIANLFLTSQLDTKITELAKTQMTIRSGATTEQKVMLAEVAEKATKSVYLILAKPVTAVDRRDTSTLYVDEKGEIWSKGTGFAINNKGIIITAKHVIDGKSEIKIIKEDGTDGGKVLETRLNAALDVGIIKINQSTIGLKLANKKIKVGTEVAFIGYPLQFDYPIIHTGIISSIRTKKLSTSIDVYTINSFVNKGNSGGPVFLKDTGEIIGLINARENSPIPHFEYIGNITEEIKPMLEMQDIIFQQLSENAQVGIGYSTALNSDLFVDIPEEYRPD